MIVAKKTNWQCPITEADVDTYQRNGYDIHQDGKLIKYGAGKMVTYQKYQEALDRCATLEAELDALRKKK